MTQQPAIRIAAVAIMNACNQMLLVRKAGTAAFMQPGGKIDKGETPLEALLRELKEELDLDVSADGLEAMGHFSAPAANEPDTHVEADMFRLRHDGPFRACREIEELAWYPDGSWDSRQLAPLTRDHVIPACINSFSVD